MNYLKRIVLIALFLFYVHKANAQLLTNNNVSITIKSATQITVQGTIQNQNLTTIDNSGTIDLSGNWINNTTNNNFGISAGTVILNGANQTIGGSGSTLFHNLTLSGTGIKTLLINTTAGGSTATGVLNVGTNVLDLNGNTFTLFNPLSTALTYTTGAGGGYVLSERTDNSSKFTWQIGSNITTHKIPFGNVAGLQIPVEINTTAGNIGDVTVSTYPTSANNLPLPVAPILVTHVKDIAGVNNSANTVDRFWQIDKTGPTGTATLVFTHDPLEAAANGTTSIRAQRWNQAFDGWEFPVLGQINPFAFQVTVPGVTLFNSVYTLALQANPLPVELIAFTAQLSSYQQTDIQWTTATEENSNYFVVEKSADGKNFFDFIRVKAAGNSSSIVNYKALDKSPFKDYTYYRLRQVDFNSAQSYSQIEAVYMSNDKVGNAMVYPNPVIGTMTLKIIGKVYNEYQIIDAQAKILSQNKISTYENETVIPIDCSDLANGLYVLVLKGNEKTETLKFVVYTK